MNRAIIISSILLLIALAAWFSGLFDIDPEAVLQRASRAYRNKNYEKAMQEAERLLKVPRYQVRAAMLGADSALKEGDFQEAIRFYNYVPDEKSSASYRARTRAGEYYIFKFNQLYQAQTEYLRALKSFPDDQTVLMRLSFLYGLSAQAWEAIPVRLELLRQDPLNPIIPYLLAMSDRLLENPQMVSEYEKISPKDPLLQLGKARIEFDQQKYQEAKTRLQKLISDQPDLGQAHVLLGQILLNESESDEFQKWQSALSEQIRRNPMIWVIEGQWYQKQEKNVLAMTSYIEALKRDAAISTACYQLGQLLAKEGMTQAAERLLDYSDKLQTYESLTKVIYGDKEIDATRKAIALAQELGLLWEAYGWCRVALILDPSLEWAQKTKEELEPQLAQLKYQRVKADKNPINGLTLSTADRMPEKNVKRPLTGNKKINKQSAISFDDVTDAAGIEFQYFNGHAWPDTEHKMYEFTGGGVGVLDYNGDGWPDIYLTQGTNWPVKKNQNQYLDRLFLNVGDGTFQDVTSFSGLKENRFSQGVSIGDVNNDGFDDIYIGNIGLNRLYINNGDGTYSQINQSEGLDDQWTTSCLIADLNGDSAPEIYAVNYLSGSDVFERICKKSDGLDRSCTPLNFEGAQDQLFSNMNNGLFQNVTSESGIEVPGGKGLGIIAADINGSGYPNLLIANDAIANFYFVNQESRKLKFTEQALLSGLALNSVGRAEACMGIAAGDANSDGLLDFYITNYFRESNTLYRQVASDVFVDDTQSANLIDSSIYQLGFGTQFLDADLDGLLDLLIVNGHVEDSLTETIPYQMQPQFMKNTGKGEFLELSSQELGSFFQKKRLGRGMARLDWNRDGLEEAAISSLDQPFVLLKNTTSPGNHKLVVRLTGTRSNRDAIGATVRVKVKGQTLVRQMTAGDGYLASNQRILVFGLGDFKQIEGLEVSWPSGLKQQFEAIEVDQEIHLIEGTSRPSVVNVFD